MPETSSNVINVNGIIETPL